jgi:hypothetical protein
MKPYLICLLATLQLSLLSSTAQESPSPDVSTSQQHPSQPSAVSAQAAPLRDGAFAKRSSRAVLYVDAVDLKSTLSSRSLTSTCKISNRQQLKVDTQLSTGKTVRNRLGA